MMYPKATLLPEYYMMAPPRVAAYHVRVDGKTVALVQPEDIVKLVKNLGFAEGVKD